MAEWTTIRVRKDAKATADEKKPDDMTWSEWIADEGRVVVADADELADEIVDRVNAAERD